MGGNGVYVSDVGGFCEVGAVAAQAVTVFWYHSFPQCVKIKENINFEVIVVLLLKANPELKKVFARLIGTVKAPVAWTNVFAVVNNNLILVGEIRSLIFNFDNKKVYTNIVDISLEKKKIDLIPNDALINNMLNMTLYAFGKWGSIGGLKVEKDYAALNQLFTGVFRPVGVEPGFRNENFRFYKNGIQVTYEDVLQAAMELLKNEGKVPEEKPEDAAEEDAEKAEHRPLENAAGEHTAQRETDSEAGVRGRESKKADELGRSNVGQADGMYEEEYELGLWHNMRWNIEKLDFTKSEQSENDIVKSRIGNNFYMTDYQCPKCKEKLYMAVYPVDRELLIETEEARVFIARAYACHSCNTFYTPRPGKLLQEGDVYSLKFGEDRIAYEDYLGLLGERAAKTVNYKFNEYEAERGKKKVQTAEGAEKESGIEGNEVDRNSQCSIAGGVKGGAKKYRLLKETDGVTASANEKDESDLVKNSGLVHTEKEKNSMGGTEQPINSASIAENNVFGTANLAETNFKTTGQADFGEKQGEEVKTAGTAKQNAAAEQAAVGYNLPTESASAADTEALTKTKVKLSAKTTEELKAILNNFGQAKANRGRTGQETVRAARKGAAAEPEERLSDEAYLQAVKETLTEKLTAKYEARVGALDNLSARQLSDLKAQLQTETLLSEEDKSTYIRKIDSRLYRAEEREMEQKVELGKNKTYEEINRIIDEIRRRDCPAELKQETIRRLEHIRGNRAEREVEHLILHMPLHLDRKQLAVYLDKINQYKEVDLTPYRKQLEQRRNMAEKEEIAAFVKRGGSGKDRQTLWELYENLQKQDYKEENKAPFLEKIYEKIRSMDEAQIEEVCPSVTGMSFAEGMEAYEKISQMMLLPELKVNTLEMIERRLTKLKTDESVQLMRKLRTDMTEQMASTEHFYFYDARKEGRRKQSEESAENRRRESAFDTAEEAEGRSGAEDDAERQKEAMRRAVSGYAGGRSTYEYPLLVGDTTKAGNGKEGFVLTPDHIFYKTLFSSGAVAVSDIEKLTESKGLMGKGISAKRFGGKKIKLPNPAGKEDSAAFVQVLDEFVSYLQERPESRSIAYLAKDKHDVKCCYRCGFTYKGGNVCPKCGSKMNN